MSLEKEKKYCLYDAETLRSDLSNCIQQYGSDHDGLRSAALEKIKNILNIVYEKAEAELMETGDGYGCAAALSSFQDSLIQAIYDFTVNNIYLAVNPSESEHMSVIATGGYGRGLLAPGSDIDLLFLLPYKQTPWGESVAEYILYFLWDLGFKVGHATRSIDQCIQLSKSDFTIRTAILDARLIWGDERLFSELKRRFHGELVKGSGRAFIEAKLAEQDERHERTGKTRYLVEPNIKDGKGGLRDLHTLYWISKYVTESEDASDFVDAGIFSQREYSSFNKCNHFLWAIRCHLHFLTKKG